MAATVDKFSMIVCIVCDLSKRIFPCRLVLLLSLGLVVFVEWTINCVFHGPTVAAPSGRYDSDLYYCDIFVLVCDKCDFLVCLMSV